MTQKIEANADGIYIYILFPIAVAFLITFSGARLISHINPEFFIPLLSDVRVHHFAYGFMVLAVSGYFALVNNSPKIKYLTALLHGFGLGLAFDEFGIWLRLSDSSAARNSYDGVIVLLGLFLLIISAESGVRVWKHHFGRKTPPENPLGTIEREIFEPPSTP